MCPFSPSKWAVDTAGRCVHVCGMRGLGKTEHIPRRKLHYCIFCRKRLVAVQHMRIKICLNVFILICWTATDATATATGSSEHPEADLCLVWNGWGRPRHQTTYSRLSCQCTCLLISPNNKQQLNNKQQATSNKQFRSPMK